MASDWFYTRNGEKHGPVSSTELRQLATRGQLLPTDLIWKQGMAQWVAASRANKLFSDASPGPPASESLGPTVASQEPTQSKDRRAAPAGSSSISGKAPMPQQWFCTRDGKTEFGPMGSSQLRQMAASGLLLPTDYVRTDTTKKWGTASQVKGLFGSSSPVVTPTSSPPSAPQPELPAVPIADVSDEAKSPATRPLTASPPASKVVGLGASWLQSAVSRVQKSAEIAQNLAATARSAVEAAKANAAFPPSGSSTSPLAGSPPTSPAAASSVPVPPLAERSITPATALGIVVPSELAKCWNEIDKAGIEPEGLLFFGATATRHAGSISDKVKGLLSKEKKAPPICHLAISPEAVHVIHVRADGSPTATSFTFSSLTWSSVAAADTHSVLGAAFSVFKSPTPEELAEKERTIVLTLSGGNTSLALNVYRCPDYDYLVTLMGRRLVELAESEIVAQRHESAEGYLARVPTDHSQRPAADALVVRIGRLARAVATFVGGHSDWTSPEKGVLRLDSLGLTFVGEAGVMRRIPTNAVRKVFPPRPGRFPPEYLSDLKRQRQSAQATIASAKASMFSNDANIKRLARLQIANAKAKLRSIKAGPPFVNRLTVAAVVSGGVAKITFDFAGKDRGETEKASRTFFEVLKSAATKSVKRAATSSSGHDSPPSSPVTPTHKGGAGNEAIKLGAAAVAGAAVGVLLTRATQAGPAAPGALGRLPGARLADKAMDTNGDGKADAVAVDSDGDGVYDTVAIDRNQDGVIDGVAIDTNRDGKLDAIALDTDGDGRLDTAGRDIDHNGSIDIAGTDNDGDGTLDHYVADTNDDGRVDVLGVDQDGDGHIDAIVRDVDHDGASFDVSSDAMDVDADRNTLTDDDGPESELDEDVDDVDVDDGDVDDGDVDDGDVDDGDVDDGDVGEQDLGEQGLGDSDLGEQDVDEQDVDEQDVDEQDLGDDDLGDDDLGDDDLGDDDLGDDDLGDDDLGDDDLGDDDLGDDDLGDDL
jgi:hypothetical protein